MEERTTARWEQDGWEVVSQKQGRLQSELSLRRPVRKLPRKAIAIGGGVAAALVVVIVLGATGVFGDDSSGGSGAVADPPSASSTARSRVESPEPSATPRSDAQAEPAVLTAANSPELATLLQLGDYCDPSIDAFAKQYEGRTIAFDGSILKMNNHGSYATRYDMLIGAGDYSTTSNRGPSFQFEDVNTTFDMHYAGDVPETIGEGTNLGVTATVGAYNPTQCLFRLNPVETSVR